MSLWIKIHTLFNEVKNLDKILWILISLYHCVVSKTYVLCVYVRIRTKICHQKKRKKRNRTKNEWGLKSVDAMTKFLYKGVVWFLSTGQIKATKF